MFTGFGPVPRDFDGGFVTYSDRIFQIRINNSLHAGQLEKRAWGLKMLMTTKEKECLVSIILPVQGTASELDGTISSVLVQSERQWTLWLVESPDTLGQASRWLGRDERIRVISHDRAGRAAALSAGLAHCRSAYTVFLDTEHRWVPNFLALTTGFLAANPLMDVVCMEISGPTGTPRVEYRKSIYREKAPLRGVLDPDIAGFDWYQGELADHLRWGEYTRMAVTLMTSTAVEALVPALARERAALDYGLQARLAQAFAVNLLALPGALQGQVPTSREMTLRQETDALAVFDEVFGRQHEVDAELDALRRARLARISGLNRQPNSERGLLNRLIGWVNAPRPDHATAVHPVRCIRIADLGALE